MVSGDCIRMLNAITFCLTHEGDALLKNDRHHLHFLPLMHSSDTRLRTEHEHRNYLGSI